jgi:hypothetical protein
MTESQTASAEVLAGVEPAEDPETRNRIIIAVVSSVVGISLIAALLFLYLRRLQSRRRTQAIPAIYPPIQPHMVDLPDLPTKSMQGFPETFGNERESSNHFEPLDVPTVEQIRFQNERKSKFAERQQTFREQRDKRRRSSEGRMGGGTSPSLDEEEDFDLNYPSNNDEEKILDKLSAAIRESPSVKQSIYRDLVIQWHPDKRADDADHATKVFQFIQSRKHWFLGKHSSSKILEPSKYR